MTKNKKRNTLHINSKRSKYSNCKVYDPDNKLMFVNSSKKGQWYVEKTGAIVRKRNDDGTLAEIQLTFIPKGKGFQKDDLFGLSVQKTQCVVTGSQDENILTKHHIVPLCYKKYLPLEYKSRNHHDVVYVTEEIHDQYERKAQSLRDILALKYDVLNEKECQKYFSNAFKKPEIVKLTKIYSKLHIINSGDGLPDDKLNNISIDVLSYINQTYCLKQSILTDYWINKLLIDIEHELESYRLKFKIDPYKLLIGAVTDYEEFIKIWRKHFVEIMKPQYMPIGWSINYTCKVQL